MDAVNTEQGTPTEPALSEGDRWQKAVGPVFEEMGMPEVKQEGLEAGLLTNAQIAEAFRNNPIGLLTALNTLKDMRGFANSRRVLSFAAEAEAEKSKTPAE